MISTRYEDFKYCVQDVTTAYIGCKFKLGEILGREDIPFKFQMIVERDFIPKADREDSLETFLYYLKPDDFNVMVLNRMKAKIKVNVIVTKHFLKKVNKTYTEKLMKPEELVKMTVEEKERCGLIVMELQIGKMALTAL